MKNILKALVIFMSTSFISACSVFGNSGVDIAPYKLLEQDGAIEIRHYERLVLVTTDMTGGMDEGQNEAFQRLFKYISGENEPNREIAMTAPVIMQNQDAGQNIAMTAPVFVGNEGKNQTMSFVLPAQYNFETAPRPLNPLVHLKNITDYTVAAIRFSGFLNEKNIQNNRNLLKDWLEQSPYQETGPYQAAGYNPPWTIPFFRRNEVLIPVEKP